MNAPNQIDLTTPQRFAQVPIEAIEGTCSGKLNSEVFRYYVWLCSVSNRQGQSWWSLYRQAELFSVSSRTIRRWRQALTELGLVQLEQRPGRSTRALVVHHPQRFVALDTPRPGGGTPHVREGGHPVSSITISKNNNQPTTVVVSKSPADINNTKQYPQNDDDLQRVELNTRFDDLCNLAEPYGLPNFRYSRNWLFKQEQKQTLDDLLEAPKPALQHAFAIIRDNYPNLQQPQKLAEILLDRIASFRPGFSTTDVKPPKRRNRGTHSARHQNRPRRKLYPDPVEPPAPASPRKSQFIDPKLRSVWVEVLAAIQAKVPEPTFNRWFKYLGARASAGVVTVLCDDEFDADFTRKNFAELLKLYIQRHFEQPLDVRTSHSHRGDPERMFR